MANKKITDLTAIVTYADTDLFEVVDVSEPSTSDQNKKITKAVLFDSAPDFGNGLTLNGGTNLLDYSIGTWTPALVFTTSGSVTGYNTQTGTYTRIGNTVIVNFNIFVATVSSPVGVINITGLPFANGATTETSCHVGMNGGNISATNDSHYGIIEKSASLIRMIAFGQPTGAGVFMDAVIVKAGTEFWGFASYNLN